MAEIPNDQTLPKHILDARIEAEKLALRYKNDPSQHSFHLLITGDTGSGKTHIARTARKPVHVDSFDPGGTKVLSDLIAAGHIVADTVYEQENREKPEMFSEWRRNFEGRVSKKYFEAFGTYVLDSSTMWADSIMNWVLSNAKDNRGNSTNLAGQAPRWSHDYVPQKVQIQNWMKRILSLPCDVIVTGHLKGVYESKVINGEEIEVLTGWRYLTTGQGMIVIPLMFDEIWVCEGKERAQGVEYKVITGNTGLYQAKTRIGRGKFAVREEPDIKKLLAKIGWSSSDKPRLL